MSSHMHAEQAAGKLLGVFDVSYTGCRLFRVSVTLGPADPVETPDESAPGVEAEPKH
jgi:hypothetical protein